MCYSSQHEAGIYADIFVPNIRDSVDYILKMHTIEIWIT